jgi:hypothetical protein
MDLGDVARKLRVSGPSINGILAWHLHQAYPPVERSLRFNILAIPTQPVTIPCANPGGASTHWAAPPPHSLIRRRFRFRCRRM